MTFKLRLRRSFPPSRPPSRLKGTGAAPARPEPDGLGSGHQTAAWHTAHPALEPSWTPAPAPALDPPRSALQRACPGHLCGSARRPRLRLNEHSSHAWQRNSGRIDSAVLRY